MAGYQHAVSMPLDSRITKHAFSLIIVRPNNLFLSVLPLIRLITFPHFLKENRLLPQHLIFKTVNCIHRFTSSK